MNFSRLRSSTRYLMQYRPPDTYKAPSGGESDSAGSDISIEASGHQQPLQLCPSSERRPSTSSSTTNSSTAQAPPPAKKAKLKQSRKPSSSCSAIEPTTTSPYYTLISGISCFVDDCPVICEDRQSLNEHLFNVHRIRAFRCLVRHCGASFDTRDQLNAHLQKRHRKLKHSWPCTLCPSDSRNHGALRTHFRYYHERGHFRCPHEDCTHVAVTTRAAIRAHMVHHEIRSESSETASLASRRSHKVLVVSYECPLRDCQIKTTDRASLEVHMQAMHGIEKYRCLVDLTCAASYKHSGQLLDHYRRAHTECRLINSAPKSSLLRYPCGYCPKILPSLKHQIAHYRAYHELGHFRCSYYVCGFQLTSSNRREMRRHLASHFPSKYRCTVPGCCGRPFKSKDERDCHLFMPPSHSTRKILINEHNEQVGVNFKRRKDYASMPVVSSGAETEEEEEGRDRSSTSTSSDIEWTDSGDEEVKPPRRRGQKSSPLPNVDYLRRSVRLVEKATAAEMVATTQEVDPFKEDDSESEALSSSIKSIKPTATIPPQVQQPAFAYQCPVNDCSRLFSLAAQLKVHIETTHEAAKIPNWPPSSGSMLPFVANLIGTKGSSSTTTSLLPNRLGK